MDFAMLKFKKVLLLLITSFTFTGCVTVPQLQLSSGAKDVTVSRSSPTSNYEFVNAIDSTDGQGCGGFGYLGTYERAIVLLRNKAATMGGDYVQVETLQTPHRRPTGSPQMPICFDNQYTVKCQQQPKSDPLHQLNNDPLFFKVFH